MIWIYVHTPLVAKIGRLVTSHETLKEFARAILWNIQLLSMSKCSFSKAFCKFVPSCLYLFSSAYQSLVYGNICFNPQHDPFKLLHGITGTVLPIQFTFPTFFLSEISSLFPYGVLILWITNFLPLICIT